MLNSFILPIDRILSGATTPGQSGPWSDVNKGVLCIPKSSSITGASPSNYLVSYPGQSLGVGLTSLQRCSQCILQPQLIGLVDKQQNKMKNTKSCKLQQLYWLTGIND